MWELSSLVRDHTSWQSRFLTTGPTRKSPLNSILFIFLDQLLIECCKVTSVVSDSVRPQRRQPTRLPHPWDSPARTLEWVAISFSNAWKLKVKAKSLSRVQLLATPWTAAYQAPPSMGFSRQEYWSGVPLPCPAHRVTILKTTTPILSLSLKLVGWCWATSACPDVAVLFSPRCYCGASCAIWSGSDL